MTSRCFVVSVMLAACMTVVSYAQTRPAATDSTERPLRVGLLALEGVYNSELMAPMDIFHHTVFHVKPGMSVFTVGRARGTVRSFEGLEIVVEHDLESAPPIDVLVVPSAVTSMDSDLEDDRLIEWVRERGLACRFVLSICDGAFVLARAGLLDGRYCTTFPGDIPAFRERFPKLRVVEGVTFVHDGGAITGVGGARSYEPALFLVEHLYGADVAAGVAKGMVLPWDVEKQRHLSLPDRRGDDELPRSWLPGQRIDRRVVVEDEHGRRRTLSDLVDDVGNVKVVVLCILSGAEAKPVAGRGGLWCEDSFSELANLRYLKLKHEADGVLFVGVLCPPVYHEANFGYDFGAFLDRPVDDPLFLENRARFSRASAKLAQSAALPFHIVAYDPGFRLLRKDRGPSAEDWEGRFRWFADTQTYGTPTIWVLTRDLDVLGPPFSMNVYESPGRKLRYTVDDVSRMIEACSGRSSAE